MIHPDHTCAAPVRKTFHRLPLLRVHLHTGERMDTDIVSLDQENAFDKIPHA